MHLLIPKARGLQFFVLEKLFGRETARQSLYTQRMLSEQVVSFHRDHQEVVRSLARLFLQNREDADDVVQEVYTKLLEGRASLPFPVTRSWLYRLVLNACRDHRKSWWSRMRRGAADVRGLEFLADDRPTPEDKLVNAEREIQLHRVLQHLPPRLREPIILRDVEGLSYEEISAVLGCSIGTVSSRLNRGRKMLAHKLRGGL